MNRKKAEWLKEEIKETEKRLSNPDRPGNTNKEKFEYFHIMVRSEDVALVLYEKDKTGKRELHMFLFFDVWHKEKQRQGRWFQHAMTQGHVLGLDGVSGIYQEVEQFNFFKNFPDEGK